MIDVKEQQLKQAADLAYACEWEQAYDLAYRWLKTDPNDPDALYVIAYIMLNTEKAAIAYPILRHLATIEPTNCLLWLNLGKCCSDLWRYEEAKRAYKKGIKYAQSDEQESNMCVNMASMLVDHGEFREAETFCTRAIELRPETVKGRANLGFCQLAQRNFSEGWANYRYCMDSESRPLTQYNDEPLWTGTEKGVICIYAEQGLGDEISFGSMLPDMQKWCDENESRLIVDVNPRLVNLFRRSFPDMEIHGTRGQTQITWDPREIEYSLPMGQLGEYFRTDESDFPGKPYLVPDPDRVKMWAALFGSKQKPVIGLAWQGGIWKTAAKYRQLSLDTLSPVLGSVDAHWVSLQYKPSQGQIDAFHDYYTKEISVPLCDLVEYPFGTLSGDYDDTVAMIAAMDMVVTMQTTVVHVAGALGVPCWTFVPNTSQWRYGQDTENFVWADSVRLIRQQTYNEWTEIMERTADELKSHFSRVPDSTAADARVKEDQLRHDSREVRGNGRADDRPDGDRPSA